MDRTLAIIGAIMAIVLLVTAGMVVTATNTSGNSFTPDNAVKAARIFVTNDATYKFDGMTDTLKLQCTGVLQAPNSYEVTAEFTSAHGGYGNRAGMMVTEALTPHQCILKVSDNHVTSAIMDGSYDMVIGKVIK